MPALQSSSQLIDLTDWPPDPEFRIHPIGSREKSTLVCPEQPPFGFLIPGHRYLFKLSNPRAPVQFWSEIVAYRIGRLMGIAVPPAHAAVDSDGAPGALIEFFFGHPGQPTEWLVHGGDYCERVEPGFERRKGSNHNIEMNLAIAAWLTSEGLSDDPVMHWGRFLLLDAIIGNTDRHQDNWGVLWSRGETDGRLSGRFTPAFDNGTSLGYELQEAALPAYRSRERLSAYIGRGRHHARWHREDAKRMTHRDLIARWLEDHPKTATDLSRCLRFDLRELERQLVELTGFELAVPFTLERSQFVLDLVTERQRLLIELMGDVREPH